jgi:hypothetical protein
MLATIIDVEPQEPVQRAGGWSSADVEDAAPLDLVAYFNGAAPAVEVSPASRWRSWMNETDARTANRCLPLLMANECGWAIGNPAAFTATWRGGDHPDRVTIDYEDERVPAASRVQSHFGYGIITWGVPFLFRTPPGWNLLARGPANWPKDGAAPLEGLVETDWAVATFTMNWKLTREELPVHFEVGFPFCTVLPQPRGMLEHFSPRFEPFDREPETRDRVRAWAKDREQAQMGKFLAAYSEEHKEYWDAWERRYFQGRYPSGEAAPAHQTKQRLAPFARGTGNGADEPG